MPPVFRGRGGLLSRMSCSLRREEDLPGRGRTAREDLPESLKTNQKIEQRPQEKKKLSQTGPLLGLGKGGIRIVKTSESSASIVTAVKIKYPSDHAK